MSFPIRVLLAENDAAEAVRLEAACMDSLEDGVEVSGAPDLQSAMRALADGEFDLIVSDLALPESDDGGEPDREHGVALFDAIGEEHPGVPVVIFSRHGDLSLVSELLAGARSEDLFGTDDEQPMIRFFPGEKDAECMEAIQSALRATAELAQLELDASPPLELSTSEARSIQIFARRTGGVRAEVSSLSGGLSGAKTLRVDAADDSGMRTAHVVAKLGPVQHVEAAVDGYERATPSLPAGLGAALAGIVGAGAGDVGAVFYRLADDYRRTYFQCLAEAPDDGAAAVARLHERFAQHYAEAPVERETVAELRRRLITDEEFRVLGDATGGAEALDHREVEVRRGIQHCDLHGLNVLISDTNEPLLIDYDNFAPANSALDPITLELSAIFHRDEVAQEARAGWPSLEQARHWHDLDAYLEGCPYPQAIRACRAWAESAAASGDEIAATLMASALRQFLYENTDKQLAAALADAGRTALE